ncbi:MAG: PHP domain-containing protein, partial [Nitrosopumilaceae archaeon]
RCVNVIKTENNLDDILYSMKHNQISIYQTGYSNQSEILEHLKYKMNNSKDFVMQYINEKYPNFKWLFSLLIKMYNHNQDSYLWTLLYRIAFLFMKRISKKINFQNLDSSFMKDRNILTMFKMAF